MEATKEQASYIRTFGVNLLQTVSIGQCLLEIHASCFVVHRPLCKFGDGHHLAALVRSALSSLGEVEHQNGLVGLRDKDYKLVGAYRVRALHAEVAHHTQEEHHTEVVASHHKVAEHHKMEELHREEAIHREEGHHMDQVVQIAKEEAAKMEMAYTLRALVEEI